MKILEPKKQLQELNTDSADVFEKNILDRYAARPGQLENLCPAEFAAWYRYQGRPEHEGSDDELMDEEGSTKEIILRCKMGKMRKRRHMAVLRTPRFSVTKSPETFYHSMLMLYQPWRTENDLLRNHSTYEDHFEN